MTHSLNEITAEARKATRGAGHDWGIADETGRAIRWLCAQGVDGCHLLAQCLNDPKAQASPLLAGPSLTDRARALTLPHTSEDVAFPALMLPFAATLARLRGHPLSVTWPGFHARLSADTLDIHDGETLMTRQASVTLAPSEAPKDRPMLTRASPDPDDWKALTRLARRTYAPASEASRLSGAGAGLTDND